MIEIPQAVINILMIEDSIYKRVGILITQLWSPQCSLQHSLQHSVQHNLQHSLQGQSSLEKHAQIVNLVYIFYCLPPLIKYPTFGIHILPHLAKNTRITPNTIT